MLQLISEHSVFLTLGAQLFSLLVWVLYLQLFFTSLRRQTRSKIIINRGSGAQLDASCFIANMGSEPIYIESIIATLKSQQDSWQETVTDVSSLDGSNRNAKDATHQGPLKSAEYLDIGTFKDLALRVLDSAGNGKSAPGLDELQQPVEFSLQVIADHASDHQLAGAERTFQLTKADGDWTMSANDIQTRQIRSKTERRRIAAQLSDQA